MATHTLTTSRRQLLNAVAPAALILVGAGAGIAHAAVPDACLLAFCAQFEALEHKIDAGFASLAIDCTDAEERTVNVLHTAILDEQTPIVDAIVACDPVTLEEFIALAKLVVMKDDELMGCPLEECDHSDRVLRTLLRGMTGRAGA